MKITEKNIGVKDVHKEVEIQDNKVNFLANKIENPNEKKGTKNGTKISS